MKKIILFIISFVFLFFAAFPVLAHGRFPSPLVPCGTTQTSPCTPCQFIHLADHIMNFILFSLAGPILVLALLIAGIIWLTSAGNAKQVETAQNLLTSSIVGIFIAFGAWLIVNTILQTFATGNFSFNWSETYLEECVQKNIPTLSQPATGGQPPITTQPPAGTFQTDQEARDYLGQNGVFINKPSCTARPGDCTDLTGLPRAAADKLIALQKDCESGICKFILTGGTETGPHQTHGPGKSIVDISPSNRSETSLRDLRNRANILSGGNAFCEAQGGKRIDSCATPANHIHVVF